MGAGKIFINYRREDSKAWSLLVYKALAEAFDADRIFYDIDTIPPGEDFVDYLNTQVAQADVLLALIGDRWLDAANPETGRRRLDDPDDFVRIEIAAALADPAVRTIPVMLDQAPIPTDAALPEPLAALARRNAVRLTHDRFDADIGGLIRALQTAMTEAEERRAAEAARAKQAAEARAAEDAAAAREAARREQIAGLSPEEVAKAEEMANWQFVQTKDDPDLVRDHLARFPSGASQPWALEKLEALAWARLSAGAADAAALDAFLSEFPDGPNAAAARARRDAVRAEADAAAAAARRLAEAETAWAAVKDSADPATLRAFAAQHPDSPHASEAGRLARALGQGPWTRRAALIGVGTLGVAAAGVAASVYSDEIAVYSDEIAVWWTDAPLRTLRGHGEGVRSAAFSPDGARIVTASFDDTARVWDARVGAEIAVLAGHTANVLSAAFSPDGARIVTASQDRTVRLWVAGTGAVIAVLDRHGNGVTSAAFSPDGARIVTASVDRTARLWDVVTGAVIAVLEGHRGVVYSAAFSPDGARIVTASADGTARLWDAMTGAEIAVLASHTSLIRSAAFSPDGTRIVTAFDSDIVPPFQDDTARLWDADAGGGAEIAVLAGHNSTVLSAAFSPDGARIVTASFDRTARLWDAGTGAEIAVLAGHGDEVWSAAFSPDGARIVTASADRTAKIWDARVGEATR